MQTYFESQSDLDSEAMCVMLWTKGFAYLFVIETLWTRADGRTHGRRFFLFLACKQETEFIFSFFPVHIHAENSENLGWLQVVIIPWPLSHQIF